MKKIAFVFPGQGAQFLKMSKDFDLYDQYVDKASKLLFEDLDDIITNDLDRLNQTKFTQPLMVLATIIIYESIKRLGYDADVVAGFSLGEYCAYYAANIFDFEQTMKMVQKRALYMDEVAKETKGAMAAIIGLDQQIVEEVCNACSSEQAIVRPANYNSKDQIVISGHEQNVLEAIELAKRNGARLAKKLNVSGAFHSKLMYKASKQFKHYLLENVKSLTPTKKIYINTTAKRLVTNELIDQMVNQIHQPVLFYEMIENMIEDGVTHFVEIGPGQVLSGLIKKISKDVYVTNIQSKEDLNKLEQIYET